MDKVSVVLRVLFKDPFQIRILEQAEVGRMTVCKITFSPKPKSYGVRGFLAKEYYGPRFSPAVAAIVKEGRRNPKCVKRQIRKELRESGLRAKAQQALKLRQEQAETNKKAVSRENKEAKVVHQFGLKQRKEKRKHRGR